MSRASEHHFPCPCGAELADECPSCARTNPLGSMRINVTREPLTHDSDFEANLEITAALLKQWGRK